MITFLVVLVIVLPPIFWTIGFRQGIRLERNMSNFYRDLAEQYRQMHQKACIESIIMSLWRIRNR